MNTVNNNTVKYLETTAISVIALLFILRPSCPFFKYPFVILYISFIVYFIFRYQKLIIAKSIKFITSQILPLILLLILFLAFIFSDKIYLVILKELLNAIVLISFFFILYVSIDSKKALSDFSTNFQILIIYFCVFISILGLVELFGILPDHELLSKYHIFSDLLRVKSEFDYNFAILPLLLGLLVLLNLLRETHSSLEIIIFNVLFVLFSASIFLSGSFRGLIVLSVIYVALYLLKFKSLYNHFFSDSKSKFRYNSVLICNIVLVIIFFLFVFQTSGSFKTNTLELIGSKNIREVKFNIAAYLDKYLSIFDKKSSFREFHDILWTPDYNPKDPDSGWGTRIHTDVYQLEGVNSEIVPKGAIGYKMDHKSDADSSDITYTRIWSRIHVKYDSLNKHDNNYVASIYCYVSSDFDGTYARLYCSKALSYYDMNKKGFWQLLKINFQSNEARHVEFEWAIPRGSNIKKINGYVIFAYPQFDKINKLDFVPRRITFEKAGFSCTGLIIHPRKNNSFAEFDPMKKWIARGFSEDTVYKAPRTALISDITKENVLNSRSLRWKFAWQIYINEYDLRNKLFGGGFTFLNWYGYYFLKDKTQSEYPHNPFLHILLYSGIVGLCLYLFAILKVFFIYFKYRNEYSFFFFGFLIVYFFTFFSGSSPFDPPVMGFFVILPFFIQSIHKKILFQTKIN